MKKLFALFLLVALVPFTVGCGLFGDNDDTSTIVAPAKIAAKVIVPAAAVPASIRAARVAPAVKSVKFAGYTIKVGEYTLRVVAEDDQADGSYVVEFATDSGYDAAVIDTLKKANVPMLINNAAGETVSVADVSLINANPKALVITLDATGKVTTVSDNTEVVATINSAATTDGKTYKIVSVKNNEIAISATQAIARVNGNYDFVVETDVDFNATLDRSFSVVVGKTTVATTDFEVIQAAAGKFVTLRLTQAAVAKLAADKAYTVVINYLSADGKLIKGGSFSFKTPATL
ncbi:MAG TPA: hypothetical protein PLM07_05500 [Candidatus Rifleibacterium sp.]|nr:hypothetical protein [Candidatus Rifleibacterium sp.]HPT45337.1 hypothetical protein [Candidatus Rifleibacterium sp.]